MALFSPDDIAALADIAQRSAMILCAYSASDGPKNVDPLAEDAGSSLSDPELLMCYGGTAENQRRSR